MKISHVRGKNISNMGYSCRFNFGKFLLVLVLFELFFSVIISSGLKRWFYEENTE